MWKLKIIICCSYLACLCSDLLSAEVLANDIPRKAAIFVENRAGAALNDKVMVLEDLITSRITEKGFSIISREVSQQALKTYSSGEVSAVLEISNSANAGTGGEQASAKGEARNISAAEVSAAPVLGRVDRAFADSTSALRLAQNLGADYLLIASISSFGSERKTFSDGELATENTIYTLRVSYKVLENVEGGSLKGDSLQVGKTIRSTANSRTETSEIMNELMDQAALKLVESAVSKRSGLTHASAKPGLVEIMVTSEMQDFARMPVSVPDIRLMSDNSFQVSSNRIGIRPINGTVELDGVAIGSSPGKFRVKPGFSKLRVSHAGFEPWERTVNCSEGQQFSVSLQMSEAGYARWRDNASFLLSIESGKQLNDGLREKLGGFAQMLRQSGYQVDFKADLKVDGKSLYDGAILETSEPSTKSK